eukprot:1632969-Prymnesium_polylepis.2
MPSQRAPHARHWPSVHTPLARQDDWQPDPSLTDVSGCEICSKGHFCTSGAAIPCGGNTYNHLTGSATQADCRPCPDRSFTLFKASTAVTDCLCEGTQYNANVSSGVECLTCPVGTDCLTAGVTLATLPIKPGYFRPGSVSIDVRRCAP